MLLYTTNNHRQGAQTGGLVGMGGLGHFDMTMTVSSPSSKTAQFHKLENKILLTQIEDGGAEDFDMIDTQNSPLQARTIRSSLNSTL